MAIILALGFMGNMVQSNSIGSSFDTAFGIKPYIMGIIIAVISGVIFLGGINRIARVTEKVVPLMALIYIVGCVIILGMNLEGLGKPFTIFLWELLRLLPYWEGPQGSQYRKLCVSALQEGCFPMSQVWVLPLTPMPLLT